ncbi:MAG: hypothetical protein NTY70_10645, partial [Burkholderiales bacterium]|nr:hypothetical protein [Burkholderiales bacterium]
RVPDLSSLVTMTERHICDEFSNFDNYLWAPSKDFKNGGDALVALQSHAQSGIPFNGYMVVETDTSLEAEQHLALCTVTQVLSAYGPPQQCATVALVTKNQVWLRGRNEQEAECSRRQRKLPQSALGAILLEITVTEGMTLSDAADVIKGVLLSDLEFETGSEIKKRKGIVERINIRAGAQYAVSKILQDGWREIIDVTLTVEDGDDGVSIAGEARPMVSRQALRDKKDYKGTDGFQDEQYKKTFLSKFIEALKNKCAKFQRIDSNTIKCGK